LCQDLRSEATSGQHVRLSGKVVVVAWRVVAQFFFGFILASFCFILLHFASFFSIFVLFWFHFFSIFFSFFFHFFFILFSFCFILFVSRPVQRGGQWPKRPSIWETGRRPLAAARRGGSPAHSSPSGTARYTTVTQ
jgi:hypothetical protein